MISEKTTVRLECIKLAEKLFLVRGIEEVIATAKSYEAYVLGDEAPKELKVETPKPQGKVVSKKSGTPDILT